MKKLLLILALLVVAMPAIGAEDPDVGIFLSTTNDHSTVTSGAPVLAPAAGQVTLYLWAQVFLTGTGEGATVRGTSTDITLTGDASNAEFTYNDITYFGGFFHAWQLSSTGADTAAYGTQALPNSTDGVWTTGVTTTGLIASTPSDPGPTARDVFLLGTLTFDSTGGVWEVLGKTGTKDFATGTTPGADLNIQFGGSAGPIMSGSGGLEGNTDPGTLASSIPEPTTMILLGLGVLGVLRRRR